MWSASDVHDSADLDQLPASRLDICVGGHCTTDGGNMSGRFGGGVCV